MATRGLLWPLVALLALLLAVGAAAAEERTEVGPAVCHPDCSKHG